MNMSILSRGQFETVDRRIRDGGSLGLWPCECHKVEGSMEGVGWSVATFQGSPMLIGGDFNVTLKARDIPNDTGGQDSYTEEF